MDSGHNCKETQQYSEQYDCYYCESCNIWLEDICTDRDCEFCKNRPLEIKMATRKKKTVIEDAGQPTVVKGSHLTVTTYPNGRTELEWDDEALMRDVQEAIASVEQPLAKPKAVRKKKASSEQGQ